MLIIVLLIAVICLCSLLLSIIWVRKQQKKELDTGMNRVSVKHQVTANPIFLTYAAFLLLILALIGILYFYTK